MNLDDESLLSAYMDGQLDPDQHQGVESALLSNPPLSEQLRTLTILRDLVGGLSRDASVDVSSAVLERIGRGRRWRVRLPATFPWLVGHSRVWQATGLLGIAASMIIAFTLALTIPPVLWYRGANALKSPKAPTIVSNDAEAVTASQRNRVQAAADPANPSSSSSHPSSEGREPSTVKIGDIRPAIADRTINDVATHRDLESVRKMLDNPNLRRSLFLVQGGRDGTAQQLVASIVEQETHFDFYKITISHGIVIDPRHPEEATVFAFLVNPKELDNLKERLTKALPDSIEETDDDPRIVMQLADIGQVQVCQAIPNGMISKDDVALRAKRAEGQDHPAAEIPPTNKRPTIEQEQSAPIPQDRRPTPAGTPAPIPSRSPEKPEDMIVVLVWVTKSHPE